MLKMKIVMDKQEVFSWAKIYKIPESDELGLYLAENRGEVLGVCFYCLTDYGMKILMVDTKGDTALFDGLIRAAMALLFDHEKDRVEFSKNMDLQLLRQLRFVQENNLCIKSANVFFETCKNCKNWF